jgi:hypothetical protein
MSQVCYYYVWKDDINDCKNSLEMLAIERRRDWKLILGLTQGKDKHMEVIMKKVVIVLLIMILVLSGCSKKEVMTDFIPTAAPSVGAEEDITPTGQATTPTPKEVFVGQTTTKYVKLTEYKDVLNVRSAPSTDAEAVGFLVHTEKVEVIEISDGWASFLYKGAICYVNADFLVDDKPDLLEPPTPTPSAKGSTGTDKTNPI